MFTYIVDLFSCLLRLFIVVFVKKVPLIYEDRYYCPLCHVYLDDDNIHNYCHFCGVRFNWKKIYGY